MKTYDDPFPTGEPRSSELLCLHLSVNYDSPWESLLSWRLFLVDRRWALLPPATTRVSPDTHALKPAQNRLYPYPSLAHFTLYPNVGCLGLKQLTAGRRAPCSSHRLSLLIPCCPACQSARPPPRGKQRFCKPEMSSGEGCKIQPSVMGEDAGKLLPAFVLVPKKSWRRWDLTYSTGKPCCLPPSGRAPTLGV